MHRICQQVFSLIELFHDPHHSKLDLEVLFHIQLMDSNLLIMGKTGVKCIT